LKRLLIVHQNKLNQTRQWNIHFVTDINITVIAGMAKVNILPGGFFDNTTQGHFGLDIKSLLDQR